MRMKGLFVLDQGSFPMIYSRKSRAAIEELIDLVGPPQSTASLKNNMGLLSSVDVILSGWGAPRLSEEFLHAAPQLKAFFFGAGALNHILTDAVWDRGLTVTTAIAANAIPVAEFTLGNILLGLKDSWRLSKQTHDTRTFVDRNGAPGCYRRHVGLISFGATARYLRKLLNRFDLNVSVYDPFLSTRQAAEFGVRKSPTLEDLFARSDVISLHTPLLAETVGMVGREHFERMKPHATFINTARGQIVRTRELIDVAQHRPDINFVLDVTDPEPPEPHSALYTLPNIILTPHIAGSVGKECHRLGNYMVSELRRYVAGKPLKWQLSQNEVRFTCHRPAESAGAKQTLVVTPLHR